jgi:hypothetical protein
MTDLTKIIERFIESEVAAGVKLQALSAFLGDDNDLRVCGEAIFAKVQSESLAVNVVVVVYDNKGRVIETDDCYIGSKNLSYDTFDVNLYGIKHPVDRIKIFLKRS